MTAPATTRRAGPFNGNGVTTSFPFTFKVFATSDIAVTKTGTTGLDTTLALGVDYSVTLNGDQDSSPGGTITYPISGTPLASGEKLTAVGALPYDQTADLPSGGNYRAIVIENALDRTVMQVQQLAEELGRSLTLPASSSSADTELPAPEANKVIGWNAAADALVNLAPSDLATVVVAGTSYTDVFDGTGAQTAFTLTANPGSVNALDIAISGVSQVNGVDFTVSGTTLTFTSAPPSGTGNIAVRYVAAVPVGAGNAQDIVYNPAGTGAVARTVQTKLREFVSVKDFGAVGDGVADDTAAIQAAADYVNSLGGGTLYFPDGDYKITAPITIYSNMRVIGAGGTATTITKTTSTPVAASATTNLVSLFAQPMGDGSGDVNCVLWVYNAVRAQKVEIAHMQLRSDTTDPTTSSVRFGIATVGMSDSHIHDLEINYMSGAAFVAPTFWFSKIELVQSTHCYQGIAIENGTTCSVSSNYVVGARTAGYYLRDMKYSSVEANACDDMNNPTAVPSYSDRSVYSAAYRLDACYGLSFRSNGAEQCYGSIWFVDSCQNVDVSNNVCISPRSDYTGADEVALFLVNIYGRNVAFKNNIVFRNNATALQGAAVSGQHHDVYVDVVSTNRGFEFVNNILCNTLYDNPSAIYGNNDPAYINTGTIGAQLFGDFTPTLSLANATGVSITYGAGNKGRYSINNGWMFVEVYLDIASVTFTGTTNIYPQLGGLPLDNASSQQCDLQITASSGVTWASTEPYFFAIDGGGKTGLARNRTRTVTLGAGGSPSFASGATNVVLKCAGHIYVGDLTNIV